MGVFDFLKKKQQKDLPLPPPPQGAGFDDLPPLPEGGPELPSLEGMDMPELPPLPDFGKEMELPEPPAFQSDLPPIGAKPGMPVPPAPEEPELGPRMPPMPPLPGKKPKGLAMPPPPAPKEELEEMPLPPPLPKARAAPGMGMEMPPPAPGKMPVQEEEHEQPEREVLVRHAMPTKPLFVSMQDFQYILNGSQSIKEKINETEEIILRLNELKNIEEKEFEKWRLHLEDVERKLEYVDHVVSQAE